MIMGEKKLIIVHGRNFKPQKDKIENLWFDAIEHGIKRDCDQSCIDKYNAIQKQFIYYGDISNQFLRDTGEKYDEAKDMEDREKSLDNLKMRPTNDFTPETSKRIYNDLPGKAGWKEFLADTFAFPLFLTGWSEEMISWVAPDMREYWNHDSQFGSDVRASLTGPLKDAFENQDDIMLVGHSLGTMISYDVLWKFSYYSEYEELREIGTTVSRFVSLGSPLGNETVKHNLKGSRAKKQRKFPINIKQWHNIAAEGDFVSQDETVEDDYRKMEQYKMIDHVRDHPIYNLALRKFYDHPSGKSYPHNGIGYVIHSTFIQLLSEWLSD